MRQFWKHKEMAAIHKKRISTMRQAYSLMRDIAADTLNIFDYFEQDPFINGNVGPGGIDEGSEKGWKLINKLREQFERINKAMGGPDPPWMNKGK